MYHGLKAGCLKVANDCPHAVVAGCNIFAGQGLQAGCAKIILYLRFLLA